MNPVHNAPIEQKKEKKKDPGSLIDTKNKTHQKQKNKGPNSAWKLPGQTDKQTL